MALNACGSESTKGTTWFVKDPADDVFKEAGGVETMPEPNFTAETAECESFDGANGWKEKYKTGIYDAGSMAPVLNWKSNDPIHDLLRDSITRDLPLDMYIQYPDVAASRLDFQALVTGFGLPTPSGGGKFTVSSALDLTGEPVWS